MRYYTIKIVDPTSGQTLIPDPTGTVGFVAAQSGSATTGSGAPLAFSSSSQTGDNSATWTSLVNGATIPGALNIELDVPLYDFASPTGAAVLRVWGVGLRQIGQSSDLNGKTIQIYAGMAKGLPLANPAEAGLILQGTIFQAFGNWQGVNQSLDFVIYPETGSADSPMNIVIDWKAGITLDQAIASTLKTAFPSYTQTIKISPKLVLPSDEPGYHQTLGQFARYINEISKKIIGGTYSGVRMVIKNGSFYVYDGTTTTTPKAIAFTDLIGQPTWIDLATVQIACVLRADIQVGDYISLPQTQTVVSAQSYSTYRNTLVFQGTFQVNYVRHVGNFRQPDGTSWITVIDAVTVPSTSGSATTTS
jgi:hypothetical protein